MTMAGLNIDTLQDALVATWPPVARHQVGPWWIAEGEGGGKRVSCVTGYGQAQDIAMAEAALDRLGQSRLFMIAPDQTHLDQLLAERGYVLVDPCCLYAANPRDIAGEGPRPMSSFPHWPPLAVARDIWSRAGVGPARLAVMDRAKGPKAVILGRVDDNPAGVGFVAMADKIAMLHALDVADTHRRRGLGANILRAAAVWAAEQGANLLALAVTSANLPARTLYVSHGMQCVGNYHYRLAQAQSQA